MRTIKITYNTEQIGGAVINSLLFQRLGWINKYYQLGAYYIVEFNEEHKDKFIELVKKHQHLNKAVKIEVI